MEDKFFSVEYHIFLVKHKFFLVENIFFVVENNMITVIFCVITKKNKFFTKKIRIFFVITKFIPLLRARVSLYIYTISQITTFFAVISEFFNVDF